MKGHRTYLLTVHGPLEGPIADDADEELEEVIKAVSAVYSKRLGSCTASIMRFGADEDEKPAPKGKPTSGRATGNQDNYI